MSAPRLCSDCGLAHRGHGLIQCLLALQAELQRERDRTAVARMEVNRLRRELADLEAAA